MNFLKPATNIQETIVTYRRWLHQHPGIGFDLPDTKKFVMDKLTEMGLAPKEVGACGIIADLDGTKPGKTILLRADMDALPIPEESNEEFASTNGKMHACGHDMHTAMLLGAAKLLVDHRNQIHGRVRFMFQPAEEILSGAKDMIAHEVLEGVDAATMIHVMTANPMPAGMVVVSPSGVSAPAADYFTIDIQGKGCHGSTPQNGVDALSVAAHILLSLQQIQSREIDVNSGAVMTIGKMNGGTAENVIADTAQLGGTLRAYDEKTREFIKTRIVEISRGIAASFRAEAKITFTSGCPTLKNDPQLCESFYEYLNSMMGNGVVSADKLSGGKPVRGGGSEDFAYISHQVPSVMLALAAGNTSEGYTYPLHHPKVRFDERALPAGAAAFAQVAVSYLSES